MPRPVQIRDVVAVSYGTKDRSAYSRIDGKESVSLSVQKRTGANIIAVTDRIKAEVERARQRWPVGVSATLGVDAFNLLGTDATLATVRLAGPKLGQPIEVVSPRSFRVGVRLRFDR